LLLPEGGGYGNPDCGGAGGAVETEGVGFVGVTVPLPVGGG